MAGKYDLTINQGETLSQQFTWKDSTGTAVNLTGYSARMQARLSPDSTDPIIDLTTSNGGISLGGVAGTITLSMTAATTSALTEGYAVWDIELVSGSGVVTRLLQGNLIITREITR